MANCVLVINTYNIAGKQVYEVKRIVSDIQCFIRNYNTVP
jgi:hypothetical protein